MCIRDSVQLDVPHLIEEWFENYFKDAASEMKSLFDEERAWFAHLAEEDPPSVGSINTKKLLNAQYWPKNLLEGWLDAIDEALSLIHIWHFMKSETYRCKARRETLRWDFGECS